MELSATEKILREISSRGLLDPKHLDAIGRKPEWEGGLIKRLSESGLIPEKDLLGALSRALDIPPIDLSRVKIDEHTLRLIPLKILKQHNVMPVSLLGRNMTIAICDPTDIFAVDDIRTISSCDLTLVVASKRDIRRAIENCSAGKEDRLSSIIEDGAPGEEAPLAVVSEDMETLDIMKKIEAAPIVKIVALIIGEAVKTRASDIHVEPKEHSVGIRYRIDGELHEIFDLPKKIQNAIIARLKIMANLDITENRLPQDGRFRIKMEGKEIDFRVSVLPAAFGNKMVMRALDKSNLSAGLDSLGFLPGPLGDFKKALSSPYGIILVTGPTGSGKSTTLYSVLNSLNIPERNILTIEDPVEYQLQGITQVAVRQEIGLDFAAGLRSMLRQSPDVIMIGEIRDFETADIAIKASLTGHVVLSTLHTNDSVGAITRLINMGIEPFLIASSLTMACAQRLLRRICPLCKTEADISKNILGELKKQYPDIECTEKFYMGKGCSNCSNTGYHGRLGTLETLLVDGHIRDMINKRSSEDDIKKYLKSTGFRSLRENAMIKFCGGLTTLDEVLRIT